MAAQWNTIGHTKALHMLAQVAKTDRLANSWLLLGPEHIGKTTLAYDIARLANCIDPDPGNRPCGSCGQCGRTSSNLHSDLRMISPSGSGSRSAVTLDQIHEIQAEVILKPYEGRWRVYIIEDTHQLTNEAANAMLKTLEEPPSNTIFILMATRILGLDGTERDDAEYTFTDDQNSKISSLLRSTPEVTGVLPTILSRCQIVELKPTPVAPIQAELPRRFNIDIFTAEDIARQSGGRPGWAFRCAENPKLLEERMDKLRSLVQIAGAGLSERFLYAEKTAEAFGRSRKAVYDEMELWASLWRDVLMVKMRSAHIVSSSSLAEDIERIASSTSQSHIIEVIEGAQRTTEMLERNVNARLSLEYFVMHI